LLESGFGVEVRAGAVEDGREYAAFRVVASATSALNLLREAFKAMVIGSEEKLVCGRVREPRVFSEELRAVKAAYSGG
jgi:hypothetical protein